jgi:hypothetical protein
MFWVAMTSSLVHSAPIIPSTPPELPVREEHQDPNKPASELNHHFAGCALIVIGIIAIAGQSSPQLRFLQCVQPFLFVLAG